MTIGTAYGFFNCTASKDQIESELPTIRDMAQTPRSLELTVMESEASPLSWSTLMTLTQQQETEGRRYVMQATLPNATNRQTADELSTIINQAYQSPLYQPHELFSGVIVYHDGNEYVFQE